MLSSSKVEKLRPILDALYQGYDPYQLESDPLKFAHRYVGAQDQEVVAFISSSLAFGQVKAIFGTLEKVFTRMGKNPAAFLIEGSNRHFLNAAKDIQHRWITSSDMLIYFRALSKIYQQSATLEKHLGDSTDFYERLVCFSSSIQRGLTQELAQGQVLTRGLKFLIPNPAQGSTCKRLNLFMRWMVRRESPDLGLWKTVEPTDIFLPIDVHISRFIKYLGLATTQTMGWNLVVEATESLKQLDAQDPIKYDFSLCRLGITGFCLHRYEKNICSECPIQSFCSLAKTKKRSHLT